jgi:hypothetical protein
MCLIRRLLAARGKRRNKEQVDKKITAFSLRTISAQRRNKLIVKTAFKKAVITKGAKNEKNLFA